MDYGIFLLLGILAGGIVLFLCALEMRGGKRKELAAKLLAGKIAARQKRDATSIEEILLRIGPDLREGKTLGEEARRHIEIADSLLAEAEQSVENLAAGCKTLRKRIDREWRGRQHAAIELARLEDEYRARKKTLRIAQNMCDEIRVAIERLELHLDSAHETNATQQEMAS